MFPGLFFEATGQWVQKKWINEFFKKKVSDAFKAYIRGGFETIFEYEGEIKRLQEEYRKNPNEVRLRLNMNQVLFFTKKGEYSLYRLVIKLENG